MSNIDKKELSETDICDLYITPAIKNAGWNQMTQIRREVTLSPGPVVVRGNSASRNKYKRKRADYVLQLKQGLPIAVVEAKDNNHTVSHGMQQALGYAEIMEVPSAFSSNGDAFASHNKVSSDGEDIETDLGLESFPGPAELWDRYKKYRGIYEDQLVTQPYYEDGSGKEPRYYQVEAINRVVEAVARGDRRLLLVMATGTGKTYTTFQIIWRLWKAKQAKRILFLVDRNILADQAAMNDFKPFGPAMTKVKGRVIDPSYEIHIGLYQQLTGPDEEDKIFKKVSPDFFDLIVIDECHRGSADDESAWREILEYFDSSIQLGLTATPKETAYVSNINYFGEPVYTYSLTQGIQDGFLAPYKVIRIDIDRDVDGWTPPPGMLDDLGEELESREYNQADMDQILVLNQRTKLVANTVMEVLNATDLFAKTIIFCENIDHAERMRKAIVNAAGQIAIDNPKYVMRITGDSTEGKAELDNFIDPESRYPVIATTSELMTTGVDSQTCKLIVLDKTVNSMTTFKQIVGRGTRINEAHNKFFFTILDFKKATENFRDPNFDGEPLVIFEPTPGEPPIPPDEPPEPPDNPPEHPDGVRRFTVSGVEARIIARRIEYLGPDGELVTESYRDYSRKQICSEYSSLDDFLRRWSSTDRKEKILSELEERGILFDELAKEVGVDCGYFDLICHIAYDMPPLTRRERVDNVKKRNYFTKYGDQARAVLESLLDKYADEGITAIETPKVLRLKPFDQIGSPVEIINKAFGGKANYDAALKELEGELYRQEKSA